MKDTKQAIHLSDEQISLYVDALRLNKVDQLPADLLAHIDDCKACHRTAIELYSLLDEKGYDGVGAHPTLDKEKALVINMNRILLRVAAAVALLLVAFFFFDRYQNMDAPGDMVKENQPIENMDNQKKPEQPATQLPAPEEEVVIEEAPVEVEKPKRQIPQAKSPVNSIASNRQLYAANFTPSEEWEDMVGESVRSVQLQVISPSTTQSFKPKAGIPFKWRGANIDRYIVVLDNKGDEVQKAKVIANEFYMQLDVDPGLYYWKLESEDDLLHVGKFRVE